MARATTANFHQMVLEVEWVASSGVYAKVCGLTGRGINRQHNMATSEVPDCDDESLPAAVERAVQSSEVTISGTGIWSAESHGKLLDWWYSGSTPTSASSTFWPPLVTLCMSPAQPTCSRSTTRPSGARKLLLNWPWNLMDSRRELMRKCAP